MRVTDVGMRAQMSVTRKPPMAAERDESFPAR
jgi:hypothetical protein